MLLHVKSRLVFQNVEQPVLIITTQREKDIAPNNAAKSL